MAKLYLSQHPPLPRPLPSVRGDLIDSDKCARTLCGIICSHLRLRRHRHKLAGSERRRSCGSGGCQSSRLFSALGRCHAICRVVAEEEGEEPDRFHPNQSSSPLARRTRKVDSQCRRECRQLEKRKGNTQPVIRGDERHGIFVPVFQREAPSDETGSTHTGCYSNETLKKLATQPQEAEAPPSLPPSFSHPSSLHPSLHPPRHVVQLLPDILTRPPDGPSACAAVTFAR